MSAIGKYFQYPLSAVGETLPLSTNSYDSLIKGEARDVVALLRDDIILIKSQLPYDLRLGQNILLIAVLLRTGQQVVISETSLDMFWQEITSTPVMIPGNREARQKIQNMLQEKVPPPVEQSAASIIGQPNRELLNKRLLPTTPQGWAVQRLYVILSAYIDTLEQQYPNNDAGVTCEMYGEAVNLYFGDEDPEFASLEECRITLAPRLRSSDKAVYTYHITETQGENIHAALRTDFETNLQLLLNILEGFYQTSFAGWIEYNES